MEDFKNLLVDYLSRVLNFAGVEAESDFLHKIINISFYVGIPIAIFLFKKIKDRITYNELNRDLHPFYSKKDVKNSTQYYISTNGQNIPPSRELEPGRTHALATKEKIIPFFIGNVFENDVDDRRFYIILADSGMGKTTFLINLYFEYLNNFFKPNYSIVLIPLGFFDADSYIKRIPVKDRKNTILALYEISW